MIFPSINDLSQGKYNRYEIALATAKTCRQLLDKQPRVAFLSCSTKGSASVSAPRQSVPSPGTRRQTDR